jgi:hypothetical protein
VACHAEAAAESPAATMNCYDDSLFLQPGWAMVHFFDEQNEDVNHIFQERHSSAYAPEQISRGNHLLHDKNLVGIRIGCRFVDDDEMSSITPCCSR